MRLIPEKGDRRGEPSFPAYRVSHWGGASFDYVRKRFSGFNRFRGFKGFGAAHKSQKRRRILVALRAYRHLERSLQIFLAEQSTC